MSSPADKGTYPKEFASDLFERDLRDAVALVAPNLHQLTDADYARLREAVQAHERDMLDEPVLFSDTTLGRYFEEIQEDGNR